MAERENGRLTDGWVEMSAGIDSGRAPNIIPRNAASFAVNCTFRGSFPKTRPGYIKHTLTFEDDDQQTAFETGLLQGAGYFAPSNQDPLLIVSISGRIYQIDASYVVSELTQADVNSPTLPRAWMVQAEGYFIIQDGASAAFIYDGASLKRAKPNQVPTGTVMAYGLGRLVVARGREMFIGDIAGGATSVIDFQEQTVLSTGGTYTVAFPGQISALCFIPILDSSTGQGALLAHTPKGVSTLNMAAPRDTWRTIEFQKIAFQPFGSVSQDSTLLVNSDIWFRSRDGIRSLTFSIRNNVSSWINTPQSSEMDRVLDHDSRNLISFCQGVLFDNRAIFGLSPIQRAGNICFQGLGVIDFDLISSLNQKAPPAWEGLWTGLDVTRIATGDYNEVQRAFLFVLDSNNKNKLWELSYDEAFDKDGSVRIQSSVEAAAYFFRNPRERTRLDGFEMFVDELQGTVDFTLQYRPDQSPVLYDWKNFSVCATTKNCAPVNGCNVPRNLQPQYRSRLWAGTPPHVCETGQKKPSREGYSFQPRISWTGKARVKMGFLHSQVIQEMPYGECLGTEVCEEIDSCDLSDFTYQSDQ